MIYVRERAPLSVAPARAALAVILVASAIALSSCSSGSEPAPEATEDPVALDTTGLDLSAYADVTAKLDFKNGTVVLPVDSISKTSNEIDNLRGEARIALANECLRESGLPGLEWTPQKPAEDRLYGLWSVDLASRYGLELESTADQAPNSRTADQLRCLQSAQDQMEDLLRAIDELSLDFQVVSTAYYSVLASNEGKAAIAQAQSCMKDKGLTIDPESGFPVADSSEGNSETNVRIAIIAASCNVDTGAIQVLYDLTAKFQAALIDRNEAAAVELANQRAEIVDGFKAIIARSS